MGGCLVSLSEIPPDLVELEISLIRVEREVALLERMSPLNFLQQCKRVERGLGVGRPCLPDFSYSTASKPVDVGRRLRAARVCLKYGGDERWETLRRLLLERVDELALEAELVESREGPRMKDLAARRFAYSSGELKAAEEFSRRTLADHATNFESNREARDGSVLLSSFLSRKGAERGLQLRVVERPLASVAAVADDVIFVRKNARVSELEARRIFEHEVYAHYLPRQRARSSFPPLSVGTRAAGEDEEGRAILLEERAGCLTQRRRLEVAVRYLLASATRDSPRSALLYALELVRNEVSPKMVAESLCRVLRGGGLAREIAYLASFLRVKRGLDVAADLEIWMERGRCSLAGARALQAFSNSMTTGA